MEIVGYFQNEGSSVYHIVYSVGEGFSPSSTFCGLRPRNRKGEEEILVEAPSCDVAQLCINCQAVEDSGMIRIREYERLLREKTE